jgi:hypothetical protein
VTLLGTFCSLWDIGGAISAGASALFLLIIAMEIDLRSETVLGDFLAGDRVARFLSLIKLGKAASGSAALECRQRAGMTITYSQPLGR